MPARTTLVTGANGFAGSHLMDRVRDQARHQPGEATPLVAWHRPGTSPSDRRPHITWRAVDLCDREAVRAAILEDTPSSIFHLAGASAVDTSWTTVVPHLQANVLGTHHLLDAVRLSGHTCRLLVITSAQIYEMSGAPISETTPLRPSTPYGVSKVAQDQLALRAIQDDGLDLLVARPFNHAGPRQEPGFALSSFAKQIASIEAGLATPVLHVGNLDARRDITDVRDVVDAYRRLMADGATGRVYNICSGRAWRIGDLLDVLVRLARVPIAVASDPKRMRPHDIPLVQGDASRIREELGWVPSIPIEQTLQDTLDWWRERVHGAAGFSPP